MGQAMVRNALSQSGLSEREPEQVRAEARTKGVSAALGLLDSLKQAAQERLEASWRAMEQKLQRVEEATKRRAQQQQASDSLDSATRSYMAWAKAVEEGKFDAQAYTGAMEQAELSKIACVQKPTPQTFIGPAPTPTATPTPIPPAISGKDVLNGICAVADVVDPVMPNPETVGGPDVGDIIDQAYVWQQSVPRISPEFEIVVRNPIMAIKAFKDGPSTIVNFICQERDKAGPYYELFPIDQKAQSIKSWWNGMDTKQKILVVGYTVLALLIAVPVMVTLLG